MSTPLVSIVIPTFNRAHCLGRALASALAQTHENLEIIVVDDASTDSTPALVERFMRQHGDRITLQRNDTNYGPARSRNRGIEASRGEYITFLDSDDLFYPDKVALQVEALEASADSSFCCSHFSVTKHLGDPDAVFDVVWDPTESLYPAFLEPRVLRLVTPAVMVDAGLLKASGGFDESMRVCEDLDLWSRLLQNTNATCVPEVLVCIALRDGEVPDYFNNILARDALYTGVFARDASIPASVRKRLYTELVDLYLEIAETAGAGINVRRPLTEMRRALADAAPDDDFGSFVRELARESSTAGR